MLKIAINGFGRIGRNFLRVVLSDKKALEKIKIVAINIGPARLEATAHMFKFDTLMGIYPEEVQLKNNQLIIGTVAIDLIAEMDASKCPWKKLGIDWVVDCSGVNTKRERAQLHLTAGAKNVLISAPAHGEDVTIIPGVNDAQYSNDDHIVSLGSCTTNAFLPMLKVLNDAFVIEQGYMTTVHAYTNSQVLLDVEGADLRRSRAAGLNIIPTTTGASRVMGIVMPELEGKIKALALRVPVAKGSLIDLTFMTQKKTTKELINKAFIDAAQGSMKKIISVSTEPIVSSDSNGTTYSVIIDSLLTDVCGTVNKAFGWYDNEWGYSCRLKDFLLQRS